MDSFADYFFELSVHRTSTQLNLLYTNISFPLPRFSLNGGQIFINPQTNLNSTYRLVVQTSDGTIRNQIIVALDGAGRLHWIAVVGLPLYLCSSESQPRRHQL